MRRDEPPYFTENGTALPARPVNVLFDVVTLGELFWAVNRLVGLHERLQQRLSPS